MAQPRRAAKSEPTSPEHAREAGRLSPAAAVVVAWLVPGAAHLLLGQARKALVFFVVLLAMFGIGLGFGGRLFPFQLSDPLVFLAAAAEWALGLPRVVAAFLDAGQGNVVSSTYEYGNTFLIAAGLLNTLIVLDARDLALGRARR
jgi:hypothetical protein